MQNTNAELYIKELALIPHPEGGFYREIYRSPDVFTPEYLNTERSYMTSIYFLLRSGEFSSFHRLRSDELWYYHLGSPVSIYILDEESNLHQHTLGKNLSKGEELQVVFRKGTWFATTPAEENSFSLFGCAVSPGFHFDDFELGNRLTLHEKFPQFHELIEKFTLG